MGGFTKFFTGAPEVSKGKKAGLIILGILLSLCLLVLGPVLALHATVFNPDCIASYVNDLDVPAYTQGWLDTYVAPKSPLLAKSVQLVVVNFEPQIKGVLKTAVRDTYSFLLNRLEDGKLLETIAAQKPLVDKLATTAQTILGIPGLDKLLEALGVNVNSVTAAINIQQINSYFDMLAMLAPMQNVILFTDASFIPGIIFSLVFIVAIILIARRPRFFCGELGYIFAICGALQFIFVVPVNSSAKASISQFNMPVILHDWLVRLVGDFTGAVMIYGGLMLVAGIILISLYYSMKKGS